jgi:hypothetical protein
VATAELASVAGEATTEADVEGVDVGLRNSGDATTAAGGEEDSAINFGERRRR